jgi:hypothetical protein
MNKERELLERLVSAELNDIFDLLVEAQKLLAQPEQTEQEPVAWMYEWDTTTTGQPTCKYVNMGKDKPNVEANFLARNFIPLYTVPQNHDLREEALREGYNQGFNDGKYLSSPKREPLSEDEIAELWWNTYVVGTADSVRNFARAIEKAHGIGGGE